MQERTPSFGFWRNLKRLTLFFLLLVAGGLATGFFLFVSKVKEPAPAIIQTADGIVTLTGGSSRIQDAVKLLSDGYGKRLLITGLHPSTSRHDLARTLGSRSYLIECCVDLDYEALDTIGNADETRKWADVNHFKKLMIVTSNYHMPRTLIELRRAFPKADLIARPVSSPNLHLEAWWRHLPTLRLLLREYLKCLAALARHPSVLWSI